MPHGWDKDFSLNCRKLKFKEASVILGLKPLVQCLFPYVCSHMVFNSSFRSVTSVMLLLCISHNFINLKISV